eukprot:352478-Chlamydomonas_euryale.AAC.10
MQATRRAGVSGDTHATHCRGGVSGAHRPQVACVLLLAAALLWWWPWLFCMCGESVWVCVCVVNACTGCMCLSERLCLATSLQAMHPTCSNAQHERSFVRSLRRADLPPLPLCASACIGTGLTSLPSPFALLLASAQVWCDGGLVEHLLPQTARGRHRAGLYLRRTAKQLRRIEGDLLRLCCCC